MPNQLETPPAIAAELLEFIERSPTAFHATKNLLGLFRAKGFEELDESAAWNCKSAGKYVVTRNDSSIIAFRLGENLQQGFAMIGAHTDSPCLKIKPNPEIIKHGYFQLGVEVYGGVLLHPWFDRDLSIAGRVSGVDKNGELFHELIDMEHAVATVPSLAIHLNRDVNSKSELNAQKQMPLILGRDSTLNFKQLLLKYCSDNAARVLDYELSCYDTQAPAFVGLDKEFIASARLDNLLSSYVGARALIDSEPTTNALYVSTDHEEVGSTSACGAAGPFLKSVLERLCTGNDGLTRMIDRSTLISCDNAHGVHPNFSDKHDENHGPIINGGPVIKINSSQRYASNSVSSARFQRVCEGINVPVQHFVMRADMACGSTIGPITAGELGVETLDIGAAQWAMHSIRETAGSKDIDYMYRALVAYLAS